MIKKTILFLSLFFMLFSLSAESFYIKHYDVTLDVAEDGSMHVTEDIDVYFTAPSHGIMRDIQDTFENDKQAWDPIVVDVDIIGATDLYKIFTDGDYTTLALGDPDKLITGDKNYRIEYDYDLGYDRYDEYDELYYNIVSTSWNCEIQNVTYTVNLPFGEGIIGTWVAAGDYLSSPLSGFTVSEDNKTIVGSFPSLQAYQAVTIRVEMVDGYYQGQVIPTDNTNKFLGISVGASALLALIVFALFLKFGRDEELIVKAEFHPPFDMTPMDLGYILDSKINNEKEITSMLFYWADKGYITIEETSKDEFKFHKIKDLDDSAKDADKKLFNAIFGIGDTADAESMAQKGFSEKVLTSVIPAEMKHFTGKKSLRSKAAGKIRNLCIFLMFLYTPVFALLASTRYLGTLTATIIVLGFIYNLVVALIAYNYNRTYHLKGVGGRSASLIPGIITGAFFGMIFSGVLSDIAPVMLAIAAGVGYAAATLIAAYFAMLMEKRSKYGQQVLEGALGYREFIQLVELDKLKALVDEDPEIFYHTLSYAMAYGLEEEWAKKFKGLYIPAASWYVTTKPAFDAYFYAKMSMRWRQVYTNQLITLAKSAPVSGGGGKSTFSGSSGFAGGGFSGGGGRSW